MKCRKRRYRDRLTALIALADIQAKDRPGAQEQRAYRCPHCRGGWHLTSQAANTKKEAS